MYYGLLKSKLMDSAKFCNIVDRGPDKKLFTTRVYSRQFSDLHVADARYHDIVEVKTSVQEKKIRHTLVIVHWPRGFPCA